MKLSSLLAPLIARKADHDAIMDVVLAYEAEQGDALERRRETDRLRQEKRRLSRESRDPSPDPRDRSLVGGGVTRVEDKPLTTEIEPQVKNTRSADADAFKAEFADLDPERLAALVEHRKRKRAAMTGRSARMFRADAQKCGLSLAEAVDTCIRRNWIALEPEWLPGARAGPKPNPTLQAVDSLLEQMNAVPPNPPHPDQTYPRLVAPAGRG